MFASIFAVSLAVAGCAAPEPVAQRAQVVGRATEPGGDKTAYCEYFIRDRDQWRVLYFDPAGTKIAEKQVRVDSARGPLISDTRPSVIQEDFRHGEIREALKRDDGWLLRYRERAGASVKEKRLPLSQVDVVDAGFDAFVRANFDGLTAGDIVEFDFASPLHGRSIRLRARSVACVSQGPSLCVDVELASGFLRWLADSRIYLEYQVPAATRTSSSSRDTGPEPQQFAPRLSRFKGTVNLLDDKGDSQVMEIVYRYPADGS